VILERVFLKGLRTKVTSSCVSLFINVVIQLAMKAHLLQLQTEENYNLVFFIILPDGVSQVQPVSFIR
jgi:hypothetical protein